MLLLIKYWQPIAASLATAALCYLLHSLSLYGLNESHSIELDNQRASLRQECVESQQITSEVSHEYQTKISSLNKQLAAAKRLHANRCILPTTGATGGRNDSTGGTGNDRPHAIAAESLIDYAGDAEQHRIQLIACQNFINRTHKGTSP